MSHDVHLVLFVGHVIHVLKEGLDNIVEVRTKSPSDLLLQWSFEAGIDMDLVLRPGIHPRVKVLEHTKSVSSSHRGGTLDSVELGQVQKLNSNCWHHVGG